MPVLPRLSIILIILLPFILSFLIDCPTLNHPLNGFFDTLEPRQTTVATVYCNGGYTLFGATSLTCQSDATWDLPMPECRKGMKLSIQLMISVLGYYARPRLLTWPSGE